MNKLDLDEVNRENIINDFNTYDELVKILNMLKFKDFYEKTISKSVYKLDYGKRKGTIVFNSIKDANEKYSYSANSKYKINIDKQLLILEKSNLIDENELILQCIEVFDWGGVQSSNIINAIDLYRRKDLKPYLLKSKKWFEDDNTLEFYIDNFKPTWSSGWTKVYSFMFSKTTIYDSRVAAFINFIMVKFYYSLTSEDEKNSLKFITSKLISFKGTENRKRSVSKMDIKELEIKMKPNKDEKNFIANKIASWLIRYITELEFSSQTQTNFRKIDKAAFMLGFDISQIDADMKFE